MEDYKKKYESLMKNIKRLRESVNPEWKQTIECYIPELKSSDDEKIRKEIISVVEQYVKICERESAPCDEEDITNWIAWLEKQGLQKQRKEWDADDLLNYNQIMHILQDCNQTELMDWLEKQSDKKSAEWSEEDEMILETVLDKIGDLGTGEICKDWLKSLKERMKG